MLRRSSVNPLGAGALQVCRNQELRLPARAQGQKDEGLCPTAAAALPRSKSTASTWQ